MQSVLTAFYKLFVPTAMLLQKKPPAPAINRMPAAVFSFKIKDSDVKTTNVNVYEAYDWTDNGRKSLGFTANHGLEIKIKSANVENE